MKYTMSTIKIHFHNPFERISSTSSSSSSIEEIEIIKANPRLTQEEREILERALQTSFRWIPTEPTMVMRADIYAGAGGIAFLYWRLSQDRNQSNTSEYKKLCDLWINHTLRLVDETRMSGCGFICGKYGIYALAAVIFKEDQDLSTRFLLKVLQFERDLVEVQNLSPELLYGLAGYLYTIRFLETYLPSSKEPLSRLKSQVHQRLYEMSLQGTGEKDQLWWNWHEKHYLGAAHGQFGILYQLLSDPDLKEKHRDRYIDLIRKLEDFEVRDGNYPSSLESKSYPYLVQWCHGAPGAALTYIKAYELTQDELFVRRAKKCLDLTWSKGLLRKGVGLCHGISGNGYAFLHMFKITNELEFWGKAVDFGCFACDFEKLISLEEMREADHMYSLFEGAAGLLLFIFDLLEMDNKSYGQGMVGFPCFSDL